SGGLRSQKAQGQKHQIAGPLFLAAFHTAERRAVLDRPGPVDFDAPQRTDIAVAVPEELNRLDRELPRVLAESGGPFGMSIVDAEDSRPLRPGIVRSPF